MGTPTQSEVYAVLKLKEERRSYETIGAYFKRSKYWAYRICKNYGPDGKRFKLPAKCGRKRKFGEEVTMCVEQLAEKTPMNTGKGIADALVTCKVVESISVRTVQRRLKELGFRKVGAIKDVLTPDHKVKRVQWCLVF